MPNLDKKNYRYNEVVHEGVCTSCGITFFSKRPETIYCSNLCRTHAYIERNKNKKPSEVKKKKSEILYFNSKYELTNHMKKLGYKKDLYSWTWKIHERSYVCIGLQKYFIERLSHKEYTLEPGD